MRKWIFLHGVNKWNDKIMGKLKFLAESQYWELDRIREFQLNRLKELVKIAYNSTPYYKEKYDSSKIHPTDINSLEDIQKIPVLSKTELLVNRERIQIKKNGEKLYFAETSGSTGKPLVFYRDQDWDAWNRASMYRGYSWYNVNPWERNGYLWGYNFSFKKRIRVKLLDELQNRFRLFSYNKHEIDKFLNKMEKASYIGGYSSMIYELSKEINNRGSYKYNNIKMVKGTSEKIYDSYQDEVKKAFGKKMISEYGSAETGLIAFECPIGNMHINMETVIVEEENSEIIVTNLISRSFPVIRYKLGDYVELAENIKCECGRNHLIINDVLGRTGKVIFGHNERYPSLTLYYVFKNLAIEKKIILNYVAIQKEKGSIEIHIERNITDHEKYMFMMEYRKYFKDDLQLSLHDGSIIKQENAKKTDFISYVKI